jgi:hypothetical protein
MVRRVPGASCKPAEPDTWSGEQRDLRTWEPDEGGGRAFALAAGALIEFEVRGRVRLGRVVRGRLVEVEAAADRPQSPSWSRLVATGVCERSGDTLSVTYGTPLELRCERA